MKRFFNLSIIVAMLSMIMCAVSFSSCSKDDDDNSEINEPKTFTVTMGGSSSLKGSFLSVSKGEAFTTSDLDENAASVEFVLINGVIHPASDASNTAVNGNTGNTVTANGEDSYSYQTAVYKGTILVEKNSDGDYSVTVTRVKK